MNLDAYIKNVNQTISNLEEYSDEAINAGIYELETQLKNRVFNENVDINGNSFGGYSQAYKAFRLKVGRDATKKDLQLTDRMRLGIYSDFENKVLRFQDELDAKKGRGHEAYKKQKVFQASSDEVDIVSKVIEKIFIQKISDNLE